MKTKLRAIGALVGRRFFISFCYCFRFWFSFSFNSCLHSSSSSSLCYPLVFSVFLFRSRCLKTKMLMREGWLTNVPLCFCFLLSSLVLVTGFLSVSMFFFFSSLFSWLSLHSLRLFFFFVFSFSLLLLAILCPFFFSLSVLPLVRGLLWLL